LSNIKKSQSDLARYAEELRQSNLDLQKYAYALSHDLKAPIRKITLFAQMIDRENLSEDDLHHIQRIEGSAHKASAMIDALLSLASFEAINTEFAECDIEAVARDAVSQARESYPDVDLDVVYEHLPKVQCDATLIGSVLVNLVVNALKYGQNQGKLDLRIYGLEHLPDTAKAFSNLDSGVCVLVEDKGKGIAEADQEAVFDIFYRAKRELMNVDGSGVGLSTCRRIMELHGGSILIDPEYRQGARFVLIFPDKS
jgi:signal transduction histidine kinase